VASQELPRASSTIPNACYLASRDDPKSARHTPDQPADYPTDADQWTGERRTNDSAVSKEKFLPLIRRKHGVVFGLRRAPV
jgi:hypothetical protein